MNFILLKRLFSYGELTRLYFTCKTLGLEIQEQPHESALIIGLDPKNRSEVEALFKMANVDIGKPN